jgi:hypothetical protein
VQHASVCSRAGVGKRGAGLQSLRRKYILICKRVWLKNLNYPSFILFYLLLIKQTFSVFEKCALMGSYQYSLRNNPEELSGHLLRGGSLK